MITFRGEFRWMTPQLERGKLAVFFVQILRVKEKTDAKLRTSDAKLRTSDAKLMPS